ncbi:peptidase_C39 like family [Longilinea arvoryzae]|uniref:Peptidase_C39 like family n=2 Tax=Longilinea arvoryzae TaxID=360412 RepID=A0A0S7BHG5_9CHLR|nr:peptidase_C39 like family [Longilinea arvoryzae]
MVGCTLSRRIQEGSQHDYHLKRQAPMLLMQTEEVQLVVRQCRQALDAIDDCASSMNSSLGYLDWVSPASAGFCEEAQACTRQVASLVETGRDLFARLDREQVAWKEMGKGFQPVQINTAYLLAMAGGGTVGAWSLSNLLPGFSRLTGLMNQWINRLPDWAKKLISKQLPVDQAGDFLPPAKTGVIPRAWLDKNDNTGDQQPISPVDENNQNRQPAAEQVNLPSNTNGQNESANPSQSTETKEATASSEAFSVPVKSQKGLKADGKGTDYGCVPTSASMITDYWHDRDETNQTLSAQDLVNMNIEQKDFSADSGMAINKLENDLEPLGYEVETITGTADNAADQLTKLKSAVNEGPVLANIHLGLTTNGYSHAVVVNAMTDEKVTYNDPWTGTTETVAVTEFDKSWGASFGLKYPVRNYVTIKPANSN